MLQIASVTEFLNLFKNDTFTLPTYMDCSAQLYFNPFGSDKTSAF